MKRKTLIIWLICLAISFGAPAEAMPDALPENTVIVRDGRFPVTCSQLRDGGLLFTGFDGDDASQSVHESLSQWSTEAEPRNAVLEPLDYYVAVFDTDGTERWSYSFAFDHAYQMIYAQQLPDGNILCRVQPYDRERVNTPELTTSMFLLDAQGNVAPFPDWLTESFVKEELVWMVPLPDGFVYRSSPPQHLPARYAQGITRYDADMRVLWQTSLESIDGYYTQSISQTQDGYIGYAVDLMSVEDDSTENVRFCVYKLAEDGVFLWKHTFEDGLWVHGLTVSPSGKTLVCSSSASRDADNSPNPTAICLSADGEVLWKRDDYYAQHSISSLYAGVPLGTDGYCVRGYQSWEVGDGWYSGEHVILHLDGRGNIVSKFVYPPAHLRSASFDMLFVDPSVPDKAFLVIALDDLYDPAGWALLPAEASVLPLP